MFTFWNSYVLKHLRLERACACAQCTHQFLTYTLSARISSLCACSACFEGTFSNIEFLCLCWAYAKETDAYAQGTHQFLTCMFSECISYWPVCSGYASFPDAYTQHFLKGMRSVHTLVANTYALCTHQFLTRMLSVRISSWRACSVQASAPDAHAQCMHQFLTRMLRVYKINIWKIGKLMRMLSMCVRNWYTCSGCASVPDAHAQGAHQFLTRTLRVRISSWHARPGCASVPDPYAQRAHKGWSMHVRNSMFSIIY